MRDGGDVSQQDGSWFSGQKWAMQKTRLLTFLTFYFHPNNVINRDWIHFPTLSKFKVCNGELNSTCLLFGLIYSWQGITSCFQTRKVKQAKKDKTK